MAVSRGVAESGATEADGRCVACAEMRFIGPWCRHCYAVMTPEAIIAGLVKDNIDRKEGQHES